MQNGRLKGHLRPAVTEQLPQGVLMVVDFRCRSSERELFGPGVMISMQDERLLSTQNSLVAV